MSAQDNDTPTVYTTDSPPPVSDDETLNTLRAAIPAVMREYGREVPGILRLSVYEYMEGVYGADCVFAVINQPLFFKEPYRNVKYGIKFSKGVPEVRAPEQLLIDFVKEARSKLTGS